LEKIQIGALRLDTVKTTFLIGTPPPSLSSLSLGETEAKYILVLREIVFRPKSRRTTFSVIRIPPFGSLLLPFRSFPIN
jgi:hypothetical protein